MPELRKCTACEQQPARGLADIIDDHAVFMDAVSEEDNGANRTAFMHQLMVSVTEAAGFCPKCSEIAVVNVGLQGLFRRRS